jgi:hypothetical protein
MDFLACQNEFFESSPLDVKENHVYALDFALHLSRLFGLDQLGMLDSDNSVRFIVFPPNAYQVIARISVGDPRR